MRVPFLDLQKAYQRIREEILAAVTDTLDSCQYINGPEVKLLEETIAVRCGVPHAVGVSSGTDALLLSLMALDIGPGDSVITTPFTFFATVGSIARLGATPVFVDIEPDTFNIDFAKISSQHKRQSRAIVPVHLFGQMADMTTLIEIMAASVWLPRIVEDAAQALGARQGKRRAGSLDDTGCFSFFPSKNLGGAGDGGMITTNDLDLAQKIRKLRNHGASPKYYHALIGGNFRLDTIQAAILLVKEAYLNRATNARRSNAKLYDLLLSDVSEITTPVEREGNHHVYNQYVIRVPALERDELQDQLKTAGVGTAIYYPKCLHEQECFKYLGYERGDFPEAEKAADEVLALPIFPELLDSQQRYIVEGIKSFFTQRRTQVTGCEAISDKS